MVATVASPAAQRNGGSIINAHLPLRSGAPSRQIARHTAA